MRTIPLSETEQQQINNLINNIHALICLDLPAPTNYDEVKNQVIMLELNAEVSQLQVIFNCNLDLESQKSEFIKLCTSRNKRNQDTALSFFSLPAGECNSMYWELAKILFQPNDLKELFSILLPNITKEISWTRVPGDIRNIQNLQRFIFETKFLNSDTNINNKLTTYKKPQSSKDMAAFVTSCDIIFDVESLNRYPFIKNPQGAFENHRVFYQILNGSIYKELASQLYQHNLELQQLSHDINLVTNGGKTIKQAIEEFINILIQSGEKITGRSYAAPAATKACAVFKEYIDNLPPNLKKIIEKLKNVNQTSSIANVMKDLSHGGCVETAAFELTKILKNPQNQEFLLQLPQITNEHYQAIKNKYSFEKLNSWVGDNCILSLSLPECYLVPILNKIQIQQENNLVILVLEFPPNYYDTIFKHITFKDNLQVNKIVNNLSYFIKQGLFSVEQIKALYQAIKKYYPNSGHVQIIWNLCPSPKKLKEFLQDLDPNELELIISYDHKILFHAAEYAESLEIIINYIEQDTLLSLLQTKDPHQKNILHYVITNVETLKIIIKSIAYENLLQLLLAKDFNGKNVLHHAAYKPESLRVILSNIQTKSDRQKLFEIIKCRAECGSNVLHYAASAPESLNIIIQYVEPENLLELLQTKNNEGKNVLHHAALYLESLKIIINYNEPSKFLKLLQEKDCNHRNVLFYASIHYEALEIILKYLNSYKDNLLELIKETDCNGKNELHYAAQNIESLTVIVKYMNSEKLLQILQVKDSAGKNVLHCAANNFESLQIILNHFGSYKKILLQLLSDCDSKLQNVLHCAAVNPQSLNLLFKYLDQESLIRLLQEKDYWGKNILHYAVISFESLKIIAESISFNNLLELLQKTDNNNKNGLHYAADHPESLRLILDKINSFAEPELSRIIEAKSKYGKNVLHYTIERNSESLKIIINYLKPSKLFELFQEKDPKGKNVFHNAVTDPESLEIIVSYFALNKAKFFKLLLEKDFEAKNVLHYAASSFNSLKIILGSIDPCQLLELLQAKDYTNRNVLFYIGVNTKSLEVILKHLDPYKGELLKLFQEKDLAGQKVIHNAAVSVNSLTTIINYFAVNKEELFELIKEKDVYLHNLMYYAAKEPELLKMIINSIDPVKLYELLIENDFWGQNLLHNLTIYQESSLEIIIRHFAPYKNELFYLIQAQDSKLQNLLHYSTSCPKTMEIILKSLEPNIERLLILLNTKESWLGKNVLQKAISFPGSLKIILSYLEPYQDKLFALFQEKDFNLKNLLHEVVQTPESLRIIIDSIEFAKILELIQEIDSWGKNVLHYAIDNPESFRIILENITSEPDKQKLLKLIKAKTSYGRNVLHYSESNSASMKLLFDKFTPEQILKVEEVHQDFINKEDRDPRSLGFFVASREENDKSGKNLIMKP